MKLNKTQSYYSHGKLLLTGEYFVLDGAKALAIPTKKGQKMTVEIDSKNNNSILNWISYDYKNTVWFETKLNYKTWTIHSDNVNQFSKTLLSVLIEANKLTDFFLQKQENICVKTHLEFPNDWGLGSSSTFINNLSVWLSINPFTLLSNTLGGSGYDTACAKNDSPILYQLKNKIPIVTHISFEPSFHENLYFIHLNKKQKSDVAVKNYRNKEINPSVIDTISSLTENLLVCDNLESFSSILNEHEKIISDQLNEPTIKEKLFQDYPYAIKSLGAWGGDFILVIAEKKTDLSYFTQKGFNTILTYKEMAL